MAEQKKAANPAASTQRSALYGLAVHIWDPKSARWRLRPRFGPILGALAGIAAILYLGLAGVIYARERWMRGCEKTTYFQMLFYVFPNPIFGVNWAPDLIATPVGKKREEHRHDLADMYFSRAKAASDAGNRTQFSANMLAATQLDPTNAEARLAAAHILMQYHREQDAFDSLEEAVTGQLMNEDYVREYLRGALLFEHFERVIGITKYLIESKLPMSDNVRTLVYSAKVQAEYRRGEFDNCLATIEGSPIGKMPEGLLYRVHMLEEVGRRKEAIAFADPYAAALLKDFQFMDYVINMKMADKDFDGAISALSLYSFRCAEPYKARAKMIDVYEAAGNIAQRDKVIAEYREDFGKNEAAMARLGEFAANTGLISLSEELHRHAKAVRLTDADRFYLLFIESHLAAGKYEKAIELVDRIFVDEPAWIQPYRAQFTYLRIVAQMAKSHDDMGDISFRKLVDPTLRLDLTLMGVVARKLIGVGRTTDAIRVIDLVYDRNARTRRALETLTEIHLRAGGAATTPMYLREEISIVRPHRTVLEMARSVMAGDAYYFEPNREELITQLDMLLVGKPVLPPVPARQPYSNAKK